MPALWDRQRTEDGELESSRWFGRFERIYRPMGTERSLLAAYNAWRSERERKAATGAPMSWINASITWRWKERAEAWDESERRRRMAIEQEEREAMYRQHIQIGQDMQTLGAARISELADCAGELSPSDARQYVKDGIEIERTARGLPGEFLKIMSMTDAELVAWYREHAGCGLLVQGEQV